MRRRRDPVHGPESARPQRYTHRYSPVGAEPAPERMLGGPGAGRPVRSGGSCWSLDLDLRHRPALGSSTWTPHAMQGSKEWIVRRISSGCSGLGERDDCPSAPPRTGPSGPCRRGESSSRCSAPRTGTGRSCRSRSAPSAPARRAARRGSRTPGTWPARSTDPTCPALKVRDVTVLDPLDELVIPVVHLPRDQHRLHAPGARPPSVEKSAAGPTLSR